MIFKSIHLKEGLFERFINFSDGVNLVYSKNNSSGKTTLLRLILYGLGYSIPNTRKIRFAQCEVTLTIDTIKNGIIVLQRFDGNSIQMSANGSMRSFVLSEQQDDLHEFIYGTKNNEILNNMLGIYYVDQEKGWTLLNRGIVIGSVHFNIEELIRGLSGIDCRDLIRQESELAAQISKYNQMFSVALYRESIQTIEGSIAPKTYEEKIDSKLDCLLIKQGELKSEIRRIDNTLSDNKKFKKFVIDLKLLVRSLDGKVIPVTEDNIVGFNDAIELLIAKRKLISAQYSKITKQIEILNAEQYAESQQLAFFNSVSQIELFDSRISSIPLNQVSIKKELNRLKEKQSLVRNRISKKTKENNKVASDISKDFIKYADELGLGDKNSIHPSYIYTSNLKELSGAVLHKTVFAFRLAYIKAIEKELKIELPIILDSPSGKEVDQNNINLMVGILKRDFSNHQIIISSINRYDFDNANIIELKDRLIDKLVSYNY